MDFGRISLLVLWMVIIGCQSSPPSQDKSPDPPSPQPETAETSDTGDESTPEKGNSSSPFDGLEESDDPVAPPESIED